MFIVDSFSFCWVLFLCLALLGRLASAMLPGNLGVRVGLAELRRFMTKTTNESQPEEDDLRGKAQEREASTSTARASQQNGRTHDATTSLPQTKRRALWPCSQRRQR